MSEPDKNGTMEIWPVTKLKPYPRNAKIHSPEQVTTLANLIRSKGWSSPIVVQRSTCEIIAGHGRRLAAIEIGLEKVPVVVMDISDQDAAALRLADNRVASLDYDMGMMQDEILSLMELGEDALALGFSAKELAYTEMTELGELDLGAMVDDVSGAVEALKEDNAKREAAVDEQSTPLKRAFGFGVVNIKQMRRIKAFMATIERKYGQPGVDALMKHFDEQGVVN